MNLLLSSRVMKLLVLAIALYVAIVSLHEFVFLMRDVNRVFRPSEQQKKFEQQLEEFEKKLGA